MLMRIMARNKEATEAYAERIESYQIMPDGQRCFVRDLKGGFYFADTEDIVEDPVIIQRASADWLYKIRLGE